MPFLWDNRRLQERPKLQLCAYHLGPAAAAAAAAAATRTDGAYRPSDVQEGGGRTARQVRLWRDPARPVAEQAQGGLSPKDPVRLQGGLSPREPENWEPYQLSACAPFVRDLRVGRRARAVDRWPQSRGVHRATEAVASAGGRAAAARVARGRGVGGRNASASAGAAPCPGTAP